MTAKEFFKKAGQYAATFLSGVLAVLLFLIGRKSALKKDETVNAGEGTAAASSDRREKTFQDEFEKDAEEAREKAQDIIGGLHGHDVADMYPSVWDSIAESREQYLRRAGEALDRKRGDGTCERAEQDCRGRD